ncbi:hypothetical protein [Bradyrhizobium sp. LHD-71]|uniref:hypothetical protein n=1 Tax=Bradyrhizobium sp. LHD-71 TaxID=3072141 RepID=UPI00280D0118|nr:hypothetical protein [Bradyrhizobium sp. LHD-71]MDQ8729413.1 hypothetical protein [Bradyrhizobium sp. LHD-71]
MKTVIAATLVLVCLIESAPAFEAPNIDGLEGVQQMLRSHVGRRGQQRVQQGEERQQRSRTGGMQGMIKGITAGDTSGLQDMMTSFGQ